MNKRLVIIVAALGILIVIVFSVILITPHSNNAITPTTPTLQYTDAITGQSQQVSLPEDNTPQMLGTIGIPSVTIAGFDTVGNLINDDNLTHSLQVIVENFLMAHSGLATVSAGIKAGSVSRIDAQNISFMLVAIRPLATYQITARLDTNDSVVGQVTFKQVE